MVITRSTALHMSYTVSAATLTAVRASISTPVRPKTRTVASMRSRSSPAKAKSIFAEVMGSAKGKVLLHCTIAWRASHLWAAYLIRERGIDVDAALANARAINLMDDMRSMSNGRQPVEDFLNRELPTLGRPQQKPPAAPGPPVIAVSNTQQPKRPAINGGLPAVSPDGKWIAFVRQGDGVTPVGTYKITGRLATSPWHTLLGVSYPNYEDVKRFSKLKAEGKVPHDANIGFGIAIHGRSANMLDGEHKKTDWTLGCIALDNAEVDELASLVKKETTVTIVD